MNNIDYANFLLPDTKHTWEYYLNMYPKRNLSDKAMVTRFAPSPTGSVHMGSLLSALISILYAKQSQGVCFLRIEDTDQKREIKNGIKGIINDFQELNIEFDEDPIKGGKYSPYIQSKRKDIYQAFVKKLIIDDLAYPCFCSKEELDSTRNNQEKKKLRIGYYGKYAKCRFLTKDEIINKINNGERFIIRIKSPGIFERKIILDDLIKGKINMPENDIDIVLLKSDGLPTYHFAHVIDDYLMGTTHVIRGDEWISSYPIHDQLFKALNFDLPKFAHISPINIKDNNSIRKISKRKDLWASIKYYNEQGIPNEVIKTYLATLINSNFEEWYNLDKNNNIDDFVFSFKKQSISGPLFDMEKLLSISKTYFSRLTAEKIFDELEKYLQKYDLDFYQIIHNKKQYTIDMLNIERNNVKPRKDISAYNDIKKLYWYMFNELFKNDKSKYAELNSFDKNLLLDYFNNFYNNNEDEQTWFTNLTNYAEKSGFTKDKKELQNNPETYLGTIGDFCKLIRVIITKTNISPSLYEIIKLLGKNEIIERINYYFDK